LATVKRSKADFVHWCNIGESRFDRSCDSINWLVNLFLMDLILIPASVAVVRTRSTSHDKVMGTSGLSNGKRWIAGKQVK
jgi:hypothetical protein